MLSEYICHVIKFSEMVQKSKMKLTQRARLRTSSKFVILLGITSLLSLTAALIFFFNLSRQDDSYGEVRPLNIVNGKIEVPVDKFSSDFEVKQLDRKSTLLQNDTIILFKKVITVKPE